MKRVGIILLFGVSLLTFAIEKTSEDRLQFCPKKSVEMYLCEENILSLCRKPLNIREMAELMSILKRRVEKENGVISPKNQALFSYLDCIAGSILSPEELTEFTKMKSSLFDLDSWKLLNR